MGICNAVGLAAAEKHLAGRFNKPDCEIVDHYTYSIMGDGCNMEGMSGEGASLAAHWGLGKLIAFYDDNSISIDGHTDISFTEDVCARYEAYGWHVQHVQDGNTDLDAIRDAINKAKADPRPSLIKVTTLIGYGSPNKSNSHDVHGAPLGADETKATRENLGWKYEAFEVPEEVQTYMDCSEKGAAAEAEWNKKFAEYKKKYPEDYEELNSIITGELPAGWADSLPDFTPEDAGVATRIHSQTMLNALGSAIPGFVGGSADLAPSNMTLMKQFGDFQKDTPAERNIRYGVREHGMGAIANAIALHSPGFKSYCATFFIFSDYMRSAMRIAALSGAPTLFVMTHDSIGVGEDGPHPPAHRAPRVLPRDARYAHDAPRRRQRDRGCLPDCRRADGPPHHPCALPPGCPQPPQHLQGGCSQGCVRRRGPRRRRGLRRHLHRHRYRARARCQRGEGARRQGARGVHALLGALRGAVR